VPLRIYDVGLRLLGTSLRADSESQPYSGEIVEAD